ncbi:MAG: 50S ribosomal protein L11 methyltransferase [Chloroflexota bacterium]
MKWLELEVACPAEAVEAVSFHLSEIGCKGVAIDDPSFIPSQSEAHWDYCDLKPQPGAPVRVKGYLALVGRDWEAVRVEAAQHALGERTTCELLPAVADLRRRLRETRDSVPEWGTLKLTLGTVEDEDWADAWKAHYHATRLGRRLLVTPLWEDPAAEQDDIVIRLNPGMAFGTGTHPTTTLCLTLLEQVMDELRATQPVRHVVDWGTGSGILAIAAAKLDAWDVLALDLDPVAVRSATENARVNGVLAPAGPVRVEAGSAVPPGCADLVLANIMADVIIVGAPAVAAGLRPGGRLIASGIIAARRDDVAAALGRQGLTVRAERRDGEWVALLAQKGADE